MKAVNFKIGKYSKEYEGFKPFDTITMERTIEIVSMVKEHIEERYCTLNSAPFGIQHALSAMLLDGCLNEDESKQVLFTLYHYGVQHGKIAKDIDPFIMYWFNPSEHQDRLEYLEYFVNNIGKEANNG